MTISIVTLVKSESDVNNLGILSEKIYPFLGAGFKWLVKNNGKIQNRIKRDPNIKQIYKRDFSYYNAANQALRELETSYFIMIGVDDDINFDNLNSLIGENYLSKGYGVIAGACFIESKNSVMKPDFQNILAHMVVPFPSCIISTEAARSIGGFNEIYRIAGDYDLLVRLVLSGIKVAQHNEVISYFGGGGLSEVHAVEGVVEVKLSKYRNKIIDNNALLKELSQLHLMNI